MVGVPVASGVHQRFAPSSGCKVDCRRAGLPEAPGAVARIGERVLYLRSGTGNEKRREGTTKMSGKVYRSELTPVDFLRRSAYMFPEKTAVVYGERRYSYSELEERVDRLASRLRDAGLQKGDRVAFLCPNTPPMLEAHYAVPAAGMILVAINTRLGKDEVSYIVEHSGAKMVFVDAELEELLEDVDEEIERIRIDDTGEQGDP